MDEYKEGVPLSTPPLEELELLHAQICQALGDPRRIQIMYALNEQPRCVNELAELLAVPQPTMSRHLAILRQRSLVLADREGTTITYRLADPAIIDILDTMRRLLRSAIERQAGILT
jgi:ArsR family transcriptional regulator